MKCIKLTSLFLVLFICIATASADEYVVDYQKIRESMDTMTATELTKTIFVLQSDIDTANDLILDLIQRAEAKGLGKIVVPFKAQAEKYDNTVETALLTYDELVALKNQINLAIWNNEEWQEVTVPQGIWKVGEDIPAGHWTITATDKFYGSITYGNKLEDNFKEVSWSSSGYYHKMLTGKRHVFYSEDDLVFIDLQMMNGYYIEIDGGPVVFTPYAGKPSFGFK